ncbi:MAG: adenylyl-sulfate kinase [Bacteroidota bacterium]
MSDLHEYNFLLRPQDRSGMMGHEPALIWFTGLSGSGKSTLANLLEHRLHQQGVHTFLLDGDSIRKGLNSDLGFSERDRTENIRRIAEVSKLMMDAGLIVIAAFISPFETDRSLVKDITGRKHTLEIYVATSLEECERRDVKGLYAKARKGEIQNFTGIDSPYEVPRNPEITIDTEFCTPESAIEQIIDLLRDREIIQ